MMLQLQKERENALKSSPKRGKMAQKQVKSREFDVFSRINLEVMRKISADSLADALTKAHQLKVADFVTVDGEHCDDAMVITGVFERSQPITAGL